jgi:hypothetical protein
LLRVPGLGVKSVDKIVSVRRYKTLRLEDVGRLTRGLERVRPFLVAADWNAGGLLDHADLRGRLSPAPSSCRCSDEGASRAAAADRGSFDSHSAAHERDARGGRGRVGPALRPPTAGALFNANAAPWPLLLIMVLIGAAFSYQLLSGDFQGVVARHGFLPIELSAGRPWA